MIYPLTFFYDTAEDEIIAFFRCRRQDSTIQTNSNSQIELNTQKS